MVIGMPMASLALLEWKFLSLLSSWSKARSSLPQLPATQSTCDGLGQLRHGSSSVCTVMGSLQAEYPSWVRVRILNSWEL